MANLLTMASVLAVLIVPTAAVPQMQVAMVPPIDVTGTVTTASSEAPARSTRGQIIARSADGLFYVDARVNGALVQFVVDSGSSVVILSAADAARAGVGGREGVAVDTAGGPASMRRTRIKKVDLAGRTLSDVDAAVVDRDLGVSLLGQSALSQLGSVTFHGDKLELS